MADPTPKPLTAPSTHRNALPAPLAPEFYTWSTFFSILTDRAPPSTRDAYFAHRDILNEAQDIARCTKDTRWLFAYSPIIRFMKHNIDLLVPEPETTTSTTTNTIDATKVYCRRCETRQSGGFDPDHGILVCANHIRNRGHLEDTLAHELVHAYDYLRFKLDPLDLRHAACTEIRASTLSGECRFMRELFTRGQFGVTQQLQECVRRRAVLSVAGREGCRDEGVARRVVDEVWESCYTDTRPFDEVYK